MEGWGETWGFEGEGEGEGRVMLRLQPCRLLKPLVELILQ